MSHVNKLISQHVLALLGGESFFRIVAPTLCEQTLDCPRPRVFNYWTCLLDKDTLREASVGRTGVHVSALETKHLPEHNGK